MGKTDYIKSIIRQMSGKQKKEYVLIDEYLGEMKRIGFERDDNCLWKTNKRILNLDVVVSLQGTSYAIDIEERENFLRIWKYIVDNENKVETALRALCNKLTLDIANKSLGNDIICSYSKIGDVLTFSSDKIYISISIIGEIYINIAFRNTVDKPENIIVG